MGVIQNGIQVDDAFNAIADAKLIRLIRTLPSACLRYDVLIVPSQTDQAMLQRLKGVLKRYVRLGGVLVVLGAMTHGRRWLPFFQWEPTFTQSVSIDTSTEDGQRVFQDITDAPYLQYHSKYVGHGSITVSVPQGDRVLASDNEGRAVLVVRRLPQSGVLLVTTLDPDFHASVRVPGPAEETPEATHNKAGHLLENIVAWARWAAQSTARRRRRRFLGVVLPAASVLGLATLYLLPVAVFALLFDPSMVLTVGPVGRFVAAIAFVGSLASLYSMLISIASKRTE